MATALAALTGEDHPLVHGAPSRKALFPGPPPMTMRRTDNGTGPAPPQAQRVPADQLLPDLALYERLINNGVAAANARRGPVDHVTARRLAIWLAARPQEPSFAQNLTRFINTGAIQRELKTQLRIRARSGNYADQAQTAQLMQYCIARGTDLGPVADNFGAACHQMDHADLMLADAHDRNRHRTGRRSEQATPDNDGSLPTVLARHDPQNRTVTFVLDTATANIAIYAIAAHAQEREAHLREIALYGQELPEGSYGRRNRQAITDHETRIATRLRAVEHEYHAAIERDAVPAPPEPAGALRAPELVSNREIELE